MPTGRYGADTYTYSTRCTQGNMSLFWRGQTVCWPKISQWLKWLPSKSECDRSRKVPIRLIASLAANLWGNKKVTVYLMSAMQSPSNLASCWRSFNQDFDTMLNRFVVLPDRCSDTIFAFPIPISERIGWPSIYDTASSIVTTNNNVLNERFSYDDRNVVSRFPFSEVEHSHL
jgi:hypothetical protein